MVPSITNKEVFKHIVLSGKGTKYSGFDKRIIKDMKRITHSEDVEVKQIANKELLIWYGGIKLSATITDWLNKVEFNKNPDVVVEKFN